MGMFDDLACKYILPVDGANDLSYQTKDTPKQFMDLYEIRGDGTLWHEDYDIEDHSDLAMWKAEHPTEEPPVELKDGLHSFLGCMTRVRKRWEPCPFTGEIRFYTSTGDDHSGWIEWSSYFVNGEIKQLHLIENKQPKEKT